MKKTLITLIFNLVLFGAVFGQSNLQLDPCLEPFYNNRLIKSLLLFFATEA